MPATPRRFAFCLLVTLLALPTAPASAVPFDTSALLGKLRGLLSFVWAENGCELEPAGRCGAAAAPNGCEVDPFARCAPILVDHGCELEPGGRCQS